MMNELDYMGVPIDEESELSQSLEEDCSSGILTGDISALGKVDDEGNRTLSMPIIPNVRRIFYRVNKPIMTAYLNECLANGTLSRIAGRRITTKSIYQYRGLYQRVDYYRCDRVSFYAKVSFKLHLTSANGPFDYSGYLLLLCCVDNGCIGEIIDIGSEFDDREMVRLDEYFVPCVNGTRLDTDLENLLRHYMPEAIDDPSKRDARTLARKMGLNVIERLMPPDDEDHHSPYSVLFFMEDELVLMDEDTMEPYTEVIPANTIVINTDKIDTHYEDYNVYHECVHYEEHYMFFRFQQMSTNDINRMRTKPVTYKKDDKIKSPLYWMERQANRGAYSLWMPVSDTRKRISEVLRSIPLQPHRGCLYEIAVGRLMFALGAASFRVKARLIQLSHIHAKGAHNYVSGKRIESFDFDDDALLNPDDTYVVTAGIVAELEEKSEDFRDFVARNNYIYADGRMVKNTQECVERRDGELKLTPLASKYVNRYCIRFRRVYKMLNAEKYKYGRMYFDHEYTTRCEFYLSDVMKANKVNMIDAWNLYKKSFPSDFRAAFNKLAAKNGTTQEAVADELGIAPSTLKKWIANPEKYLTADFVTKLILLLKLPDWISAMLLDRAYIKLSDDNPRHIAIQYIIRAMWNDGMEKADEYLVANGFEPLTIK